jgi:Outer membrane protein beta-barrel domain
MQYVDDDMDDLFRRAAENYPLKIVTKDWDDICPVLPAALPMLSAGKKKRYISTLLLAAVLLATGIVLMMAINASVTVKKNHTFISKNKTQSSAKTITGKTAQLISGASVSIEKSLPPPLGKREQTEMNQVSAIQKENTLDKTLITGNNTVASKAKASAGNLPDIKPVVFSMAVIPYAFTLQAIKVSRKEIPAVIAVATQTEINKKNKNARLYFKIEAGLQSNQVESQGFGKSGISAGLFAGYRLNRHVSVETGIGWSKRYFFTDAKHFDMSKAGSGMPANMILISLKSKSNIFEIPVSFRYLIHQNNNAAWSLVAGLSSFIYSKESNDYLALVNGQQQIVKGRYTNHKSYFSAAAQFGAGYEYNLNKRTHVNFEPYIQVPLKGIGIGQVQLMTAGLHIGITRYTHH